jgi:peptide-methionine (S)-S-oxide reductase
MHRSHRVNQLPLKDAIGRILLSAGIFNWGAGMGMGPVKGFTNPEVKEIIGKQVEDGAYDIPKEEGEHATFAAGCFWGVQLAFQRVPGVMHTMVGYTAGAKEHPAYKEVCAGTTGHTEAVELIFNPQAVSYKELLMVLFDRMDPTTLNRQGNDSGTQYRSGIYYHTDAQKSQAEEFINEIQPKYSSKIVVEVKKAAKFWPAEDYHQRYLEKGRQKANKGCTDPIKCYG